MQTFAPSAALGSVFAAMAAMIASMDLGMLSFVFVVVLVAVICAIVAYVLAMQHAKSEIVKTFELQIKELHKNHILFVEKYGRLKDRRD